MPEIELTIYRFTGKQFFFEIPPQWCEECDLTIALTRSVLKELGLANDRRVRLIIKPWLANVLRSLSSGGWHPPVLLINGEVFSQGVVPDRARLKKVLARLLSLPPVPVNSSSVR